LANRGSVSPLTTLLVRGVLQLKEVLTLIVIQLRWFAGKMEKEGGTLFVSLFGSGFGYVVVADEAFSFSGFYESEFRGCMFFKFFHCSVDLLICIVFVVDCV